MKKPRISICIPTYEMNGLGDKFLEHSFNVLLQQKFKDFNVIISDHSKTDLIKNLCKKYKNKLNIEYYRNKIKKGSSSANINNAITKANGELIKILFQDDFLYNKYALEDINKNFNTQRDFWLVTACMHTKDGKKMFRPLYPKYNHKIHLGKNTISSPSVVTILNKNPLLFNENLIWLMDCDYYKRCYEKFGKPQILNKINVVNRVGDHQVSNTIANNKVRETEYQYTSKHQYKKSILKEIKLKINKWLR